jgi:CheY-like chemotaxis protein
MAGELIFIVEDERIVAEDLKRMLQRLGYQVVGSAASGDEAIKQVEEKKPHLVLMDIRIQGPLDGIDVAERIYAEYDIPVVYLTAYADDTTVDRAKGTLASGYILKPFEERSLKTTIELALYRHSMEQMIKNVEEWHGEILGSLDMAVLAVDNDNNITYLNKTAEALTECLLENVLGHPITKVLSVETSQSSTDSFRFFINKNGVRVPLECASSLVKDQEGKTTGTAHILKAAASPSSEKS